ncbi:MAG TPA: chitobiase/beta-hexosaminidase C-terminal domain-containing protein, partial [Candidatus Wallbacteria bacterium]|nr:chitobiase/beta-hexosaminidase C-terminal domain-containing protein [Candidatus Wallbacteria bacterium]
MSTSKTIKTIATKTGMTDSTVTSASFMINIPLPQVAAPVISPNGGTFDATQSVTITSTTAGAIIKYTLDGSTPSASNGSTYSGAISLSESKTIKAIATKTAMTDSTLTTASFSISIPLVQAAAPTFGVTEGTFDATQSVVLSSATAGASIYYTIDGSAPTSASALYSSEISVGVNTTVKAIAVKSGMADSNVASATYNIRAAAPAFNPAAGSFSSAQNITITSATPGATIKYTTDSSTPSATNGLTYSSPISLGTTTTVKAIAIKTGMTDSNVSTALYSITIYSGGGGTPPADTTPPTFAATYPKTATVATTTLDLKVQSSESGTAYYVILADGDSAPIAAQVKNGTDASNGALAANLKGSLTLTANTEATANITGLTAGTAYDIYVVAQDGSSNLQASPVKVDVTTINLLDLSGVGINVVANNLTGTATTMQYSLDSTDGSNGTWTDCTLANTAVTFVVGKVYVREKNQTTNFRLVATIAAVAAAPNITYSFDGVDALKLKNSDSTMEFSVNGGTVWSACGGADHALTQAQADGLTNANGLKIRIKATGTTQFSATKSIAITDGAAAPNITYSFDGVDALKLKN